MSGVPRHDHPGSLGELLRDFSELFVRRLRKLLRMPRRTARTVPSIITAMKEAGAAVAGEDAVWDAARDRLSLRVTSKRGTPHIAEWSMRDVDAQTFADSLNDNLVANCFWAETPSGPRWCAFFGEGNIAPGHWKHGGVVELRRADGRRDSKREARLVQLGAMASTLSHELKQPLATIAFAAENGRLRLVGQSDTNSQKALEKFDKILEQVERARAISGKMLAHAKSEADAQAEFDLESAIRAAQSQTANLMERAGVQFGELSIPEPASILGFSRLSFELILLNGFRNAIQAIREARARNLVTRGRIDINVKRLGNGGIALSIIDDGSGISPEIADKLFHAFSTSKKGEEGNGIGLYMCRQLVEKVGGSLDLVSNPDGRGARLVMTFPEDAVRFTGFGGWQHP